MGAGVISALVATFLVFVGAKYWNRVVLPWYEDRVYRDIRLAGEWRTVGEEEGGRIKEVAKVRQKAHRVWGEIVLDEQTDVREYEFEGEFKNLILTARYWTKGESDLDRGTFTLMLRDNGGTLKGCYAWYGGKVNDVVSGKYEWTKR
jgi:hypothetical protein